MKISTWAYSLKQGIINIKRNKLFSLASIATIAICIFLIGLFYSVFTNINNMITQAEEQISITVFFKQGITDDEINSLKDKISQRAEVKEVVNSSENTASTVSEFGKLVGYVSVALIVILLAVAVFLISNTITMGITVRKEEIGIMKLMGASDIFVRAPFMVEGLMIGLIGAVIPIVVLFILYNRIVVYILAQFQQLSAFTVFLPANQVFHVLAPLSLLIGAGIGLVGSMITIKKHLNV